MDTANRMQRIVYGFCLIAGPFLLGVSTFFWKGIDVGLTGGTIQVYSFVFWIPAFFGLFGLLRQRMPRLALLGSMVAVYTCIGGNNFGMDGIYREAFALAGATTVSQEALLKAMGVAGPLILFLPGLLFPLTLLTAGIGLLRAKAIPAWCAVMICVGAVCFPLSRIPRIEALAHAADLLLFIPLAWIGWQYLRSESELAGSELGLSAAR